MFNYFTVLVSETINKSNNSSHKNYYNILNVTKMYLKGEVKGIKYLFVAIFDLIQVQVSIKLSSFILSFGFNIL